MSKESIGQESVAKARWVAEIEANLQKGDFAKAKGLVQRALSAFPEDDEFYVLEERAIKGREQCALAFQLMEEGHQLCTDLNFDEGIEVLRNAYSLDNHNSVIRTVLVDNLLTHARTSMERNLAKAGEMAVEALKIDPENSVAKGLVRNIEERKKAPPKPEPPAAQSSVQPAANPAPAEPRPIAPISIPAPRQPIAAPQAPIAAPRAAALATTHQTAPMPPAAQKNATVNRAAVPSEPAAQAAPLPEPQFRHEPRASLDLPAAKPKLPEPPEPQDAAEPVERTPPKPNWILIAACIVLAILGGAVVKKRSKPALPVVEPVSFEIRTAPPGAKLRINGQLHDFAGQVSLAPGDYHLEAQLDGYTTAMKDVQVAAGFKGPVDLILTPIIPDMRVVTDLDDATLQIDEQPPTTLDNGSWALDRLAAGEHVLTIKNGNASQAIVNFSISDNDIPSLLKPIGAKNLRVVFVGSRQTRGQIYSTSSPVQVTIDGRPSGQVPKSAALSLVGLTQQSHELLIGDDDSQQKIQFDVSPSSGVYISAVSDRNIGTLEIAANEDNFQVLVNGRKHGFSKLKGRFVLRNLDARPTTIQLLKAGYQVEPPEQKIVVKKGETTSVSFRLTPIPVTAALHLVGAAPGTRISIDGKAFDLAADGSLNTTVNPGEHAVEIRRNGFTPKTIHLSFKAGQTVNLSGSDVAIDSPLTGKIVVSKTPASAKVVLRRKDGSEIVVSEHESDAPEGEYTLVATAAGFKEYSRPVRIAESAPATADIKLAKIAQTVGMEGWDDPGGWDYQDGWHVRKGGNFVLFNQSSNTGTLHFVARRGGGRQLPFLRGGRVQWLVNFVNGNNYELYQLDKDKVYWKKIADGKPGKELHADHGIAITDDTYELTLEFRNGTLTQKLRNGEGWKALPQLGDDSRAVPDSRFGFYLPGKDELRISKFDYKPAD